MCDERVEYLHDGLLFSFTLVVLHSFIFLSTSGRVGIWGLKFLFSNLLTFPIDLKALKHVT